MIRHFSLNLRMLHKNLLIHHPARELFSEKTLRISDYESQRLKIKDFKFSQKRLLFELKSNNIPKLIDSTKQWIHMMDKRDCETDFLLLQQCLRQIRKSADPSSTFNFGPTTMRMLHYLNLPDQAIRLYYDLYIGNMFHQLSCVLIFCDLLFNNGLYNEMYSVIKSNCNQSHKNGTKTSRLLNYLLFAASYKLKTQESFDFAFEIWNKSVKEHQLTQSINFLSMCAINLGHAQIALDILPLQDKHFASSNVRLLALSECGQFTEIIHLMTDKISTENQFYFKISEEVVQKMKKSLPTDLSADDSTTFENLLREYYQKGRISKTLYSDLQIQKSFQTIDEILCWPVSANINKPMRNDQKHVLQD